MSLEKSEILKAGFESHAGDLEKAREKYEQRMSQMAGAAGHLKGAAKRIGSLMQIVKDEISKGAIKVPENEIELTRIIATWVGRSQSTCLALADLAETEGFKAEGILKGLDISIGVSKKRAEAENAKAEGQRDAENKSSDGAPVIPIRPGAQRPVGVRPDQSQADARKASSDATGAADKPKVDAKDSGTNGVGKPSKRRRTRKRKT